MNEEQEKKILIYEELEVAMLLTATGGFMDAYSYLTHNTRFATLQSGNVILMALNLVKGKFVNGMIYLFPIVAFAIGAAISFLLKRYAQKNNLRHHQLALFIEISGITLIGALANILSNNLFISLLALVAAIQADTFTKLRGMPYANIMTTGNIKTTGFMLFGGLVSKNKIMLAKGRNSFLVVLSFFVGAILSALLVPLTKNYTILGAAILLLLVFFLIQKENKLG